MNTLMRHGNKGVTSSIYPDDEMPYITTDSYTDELGVVHPAGEKEPVEIITNPLAIPNSLKILCNGARNIVPSIGIVIVSFAKSSNLRRSLTVYLDITLKFQKSLSWESQRNC